MNKKRLFVCLGALLVLGVLAALAVPFGKKIMQERQEAKEAAQEKQTFTKFHPLLKSLQEAAIKIAKTRTVDWEHPLTFDDLKVPLPPGIIDDMRFRQSYTILGQDGEEAVIDIYNSYIVITLPQEDEFPGTGVFYFFKNDRYFSFPPGSIVCYGYQRSCPEGTGMVGEIGDYLKDEIKNSPEIPCIAMGYQQAICLVGDRTSKS